MSNNHNTAPQYITPATPTVSNSAIPSIKFFYVYSNDFTDCVQYNITPPPVNDIYQWISTIQYNPSLSNTAHNNTIQSIDIVQQHEFIPPTTPLKHTNTDSQQAISPAKSIQAGSSTPIRSTLVHPTVNRPAVLCYGKQPPSTSIIPAVLNNDAALLFDSIMTQSTNKSDQQQSIVDHANELVQSMHNALHQHFTNQHESPAAKNNTESIDSEVLHQPIDPRNEETQDESAIYDASPTQQQHAKQQSGAPVDVLQPCNSNDMTDIAHINDNDANHDVDHHIVHSESYGRVQQPSQSSSSQHDYPIRTSDPVCTQHSIDQSIQQQQNEHMAINNNKVTFIESTHIDHHTNTIYKYYNQCVVHISDTHTIELSINDYIEVACNIDSVPTIAHIQQMYESNDGNKVCFARYVHTKRCIISWMASTGIVTT